MGRQDGQASLCMAVGLRPRSPAPVARSSGPLCPIENIVNSPGQHGLNSPLKRQRTGEDGSSVDCASAEKPLDLLAMARGRLRNPGDATSVPMGREHQHQQLQGLVASFLASGQGTAAYVSGLPGTGKSHTVSSSLAACRQQEGEKGLPATFTWINCMSVTSAQEVYQQIAASTSAPTSNSSSSSTIPATTSLQQLGALLAKPCPTTHAAGKRRGSKGAAAARRHVIVLDEIDNLMKKGPQDVFDLFMLPHQPNLAVLVIGIANSIDLTERALPELQLLGCTPKLVCFPAYTTKQISAILHRCLEPLPTRLFDPTAIDLCSRSVASSSGDLRVALKAACWTLERLRQQLQQQQEQQQQQAGALRIAPKDMMQALASLSGKVTGAGAGGRGSHISNLPNQQQLLLYSLSVLCPPCDSSQDPDDSSSSSHSSLAKLWGLAERSSSSSGSSSSSSGYGTPPGAGLTRSRSKTTPAGGGSSSSKKRPRLEVEAAGRPRVCLAAAGLEELWGLCCKVCKQVGVAQVSKEEAAHMVGLLGEVALVELLQAPGGGGGAGGGAHGGSRPAGFGKGGRGRRSSVGGAGAAGALLSGSCSGVRVALKVGHEEVVAALRLNPLLRSLLPAN